MPPPCLPPFTPSKSVVAFATPANLSSLRDILLLGTKIDRMHTGSRRFGRQFGSQTPRYSDAAHSTQQQ